MTNATFANEGRRATLGAILLGGFVAASVDIAAASIINNVNPLIICRAVAGGLLGDATFEGGAASAILGFILQEGMGLIIAAIFVFAATRLAWLYKEWISAGMAYGVVIFLVMNYVVVPLSAYHRLPRLSTKLLADFAAMLLFGLIVSSFTRHFLVRREISQYQANS